LSAGPVLSFVEGQPLTGCHYRAAHLETNLPADDKKGFAFFISPTTNS
jgi:hypothetical protein